MRAVPVYRRTPVSKSSRMNQTMTFVPQTNEERALKWIRWMGALQALPRGVYVESPASGSIRGDDCSAGALPALPFSASLLVAGPYSLKALRNDAVNGLPGQHQ